MSSLNIPSSAVIGVQIERAARALAMVVAVAIVAVGYTYRAGYTFGRWLHRLNDRLAQASHDPALAATRAAATAMVWAEAQIRVRPQPAPSLIVSAIEAQTAAEPVEVTRFSTMTVAELRAEARKHSLTGASKLRKAQLVEALVGAVES